jgi:hypothetical protein
MECNKMIKGYGVKIRDGFATGKQLYCILLHIAACCLNTLMVLGHCSFSLSEWFLSRVVMCGSWHMNIPGELP